MWIIAGVVEISVNEVEMFSVGTLEVPAVGNEGFNPLRVIPKCVDVFGDCSVPWDSPPDFLDVNMDSGDFIAVTARKSTPSGVGGSASTSLENQPTTAGPTP